MIYWLPVITVLSGYFLVLGLRPKKNPGITLLLAFSGSFLLATTLFELLPSIYLNSNAKEAGLYIMLGIVLQIFLEFFSKGAEHGHMHLDIEKTVFPWLLLLSLCVHAFLEGVPISENQPILYAILVHKLPVAIILSIFLINSRLHAWQGALFMIFFALMTPLGSYVAQSSPSIERFYVPLTAIVIGVFLHISTVILFESSKGHSFNLRKLIVILLGLLIAYLIF
ncbi:ZIP family metal transporter [Lentiprolixibacter aurantiacus]|uniref:ZIP family metal transporter n=1 Tax=Lentiprolixibacter aurantiacus TaxID=2993939 RepID=A0AAE3MKZ7_9FLAO|nr:ZIP family metal transporter [Lentiprolixibacter aurantiacus]MCX2719344.1 ZIP family metal transporter [Lentiprolixibacter aurantiacus]